MATRGAADSYYNSGPPPNPVQSNQGRGYQDPNQPKYEQAPPNYGQNFQTNGEPQGDGKQTFAQAFKLDKPKYNDLWAGILVRRSRMAGSMD